MATNPMQRKARNSFLLGMLLMLIIALLPLGFLFMQLTNVKKEEQKEKNSYVQVCVLNKEVKSGEELTSDDFTTGVKTLKTAAPTNAMSIDKLGDKNIAKINMTAGTILTSDNVYVDETVIGNDVRKQEYNMIVLPMDLITGDYIDIRLSLPSGQDFIVASKKKVEIPQVANIDSVDTVWMNLSEEEILAMSNAIYDAYKINGSKLYATKYTEPGIQEAATPTYAVNEETTALINGDPNILAKAKEELIKRYGNNNGAIKTLRNEYINRSITSAGEEAQSRVETGIQSSITNSQETRKEYLDSLSGVEQ